MIFTGSSKWTAAVITLIMAGLLLSCNGLGTPDRNFDDPDLTGAEWLLTSINDKPLEVGTQARLAFGEESGILGSTGCNLFKGTYSLEEGEEINFQANLATSWECEVPYFSQEAAMLLVLESSTEYVLQGNELEISSSEGDLRGVFTKTEPLALGGTVWILDVLNDGQGASVEHIEGVSVSAVFDNEGSLSGSGGCNDYNTTYAAQSANISVEPIIATQSSCSEPEGVMDQEKFYFAALERASTFRNYGIALMMFDVEGDILATFLDAEFASRR